MGSFVTSGNFHTFAVVFPTHYLIIHNHESLRNRFHFNSRFVWCSDEGSGRQGKGRDHKRQRYHCQRRELGPAPNSPTPSRRSRPASTPSSSSTPNPLPSRSSRLSSAATSACSRWLTFRLDKYAAEYAAKRRSLRSAKTNATETVEAKED